MALGGTPAELRDTVASFQFLTEALEDPWTRRVGKQARLAGVTGERFRAEGRPCGRLEAGEVNLGLSRRGGRW